MVRFRTWASFGDHGVLLDAEVSACSAGSGASLAFSQQRRSYFDANRPGESGGFRPWEGRKHVWSWCAVAAGAA